MSDARLSTRHATAPRGRHRTKRRVPRPDAVHGSADAPTIRSLSVRIEHPSECAPSGLADHILRVSDRLSRSLALRPAWRRRAAIRLWPRIPSWPPYVISDVHRPRPGSERPPRSIEPAMIDGPRRRLSGRGRSGWHSCCWRTRARSCARTKEEGCEHASRPTIDACRRGDGGRAQCGVREAGRRRATATRSLRGHRRPAGRAGVPGPGRADPGIPGRRHPRAGRRLPRHGELPRRVVRPQRRPSLSDRPEAAPGRARAGERRTGDGPGAAREGRQRRRALHAARGQAGRQPAGARRRAGRAGRRCGRRSRHPRRRWTRRRSISATCGSRRRSTGWSARRW